MTPTNRIVGTLPLQFRPEAVARYWPTIQAVITSWPVPVCIDPKPFSPTTFSCRFRDAIRAITEYGQGDHEQTAAIMPIYKEIMVQSQPTGTLLIGPRDYLRANLRPATVPGQVLAAKITTKSIIDSPSHPILSAIFVLLDSFFIEHVTVSNVDENLLREMAGKCNRPIEIVPTSTNTFTLF